jgi:integrase
MGRLALKNVHEKKDGRLYYRRKVNGKDVYTRLPAADDPDFQRAYQQASQTSERQKPGRGTLAALVADFRASSEFRSIPSPVTRANDSRYLDMIATEDGHRSVRGVTPFFVRKMRDRYQDTPGKANNWLRVFRSLLSFAAQNDWRNDNPASGVKFLKIGEREPWPAEVLERALEAASPMTRLAIITGLCSGARIGDVIRMQHGWHDGAIMQFTASKNKVDVAVPMHPFWLAEIAALPRKSVTLLYDRAGKPFGSTGTLQSRLRDLMKSIDADGFTFHGLRKNACCYLAELGLNDSEIGSIVGMSPEMVRHYTKRKRAYMIALGAADRVTTGTVVQMMRGDKPANKGGQG